MSKYYVGIGDEPPKRRGAWLLAGLLVLALLGLALCRGRGPANAPSAIGNGLNVETTTADTTVPADNALAPSTGNAMQPPPAPGVSSETSVSPSASRPPVDLHGAKLCRRSVGTDGTARIVCRNEAGEWRDALSGEAAPAPGPEAPADASRPGPAAPAIISNPDWVRRPDGDELAQYYPDRAQRLEQSGRVVMACSVTETGSLTGCGVVSEDPAGFGFGDATLKIAHFFQMRPKQVDGTPVGGGSVTIPVRWSLGP